MRNYSSKVTSEGDIERLSIQRRRTEPAGNGDADKQLVLAQKPPKERSDKRRPCENNKSRGCQAKTRRGGLCHSCSEVVRCSQASGPGSPINRLIGSSKL